MSSQKLHPDCLPTCCFNRVQTKPKLEALMGLLVDAGLLVDPVRVLAHSTYTPTSRGWLRIDDLVGDYLSRRRLLLQCGFIHQWMPLTKTGLNLQFANPVIGLCRIDNKEHVNKIDDEIVTEFDAPNSWSLTLHAKEKRCAAVSILKQATRWRCQYRSFGPAHSNLKTTFTSILGQYNHIVWDTPQTLRRLLKARIGAVIGGGPLLAP